jgi:YggT family protein
MITFIHFIVSNILGLLIFAIIASAILSWLFAFNVLNYRNSVVNSIARVLEAVTSPVLRPFQRFIPTLGGVDLSPIFAILVLQGIKDYLLPWALAPLARLIG